MSTGSERLARILARLEEGPARRTAEEEEQILKKRAALAARAREEVREPEARVVLFRASGELYAVDFAAVSSITMVRSMTPLPGVPSALAGLLSVRGKHVTAVDLGLFLQGTARKRRIVDAGKAVVISSGDREVALIAEELLGIRDLFEGELHPIAGASQSDPVTATGPDGMQILDIAALFQDPRLALSLIHI